MLRRVMPGPLEVDGASCTAGALFRSGLEFNPPAHGTWNIVHVGMLVPESHQVYVCATNCMRGVVLTAQEMGAEDRFSCVLLHEEDIVRGTVEDVTREGVSDVLEKLDALGRLPRCVMVFPVCTHLFLGINMNRVYADLERRWPQVDFVRAFMDPISRRRITPDQRLRREMLSPIEPLPADASLVAHVGSDFALEDDADLKCMAAGAGHTIASVHDATTYDEFLGLGAAGTILATYPSADLGARKLAQRLGRRYLYLPKTFDADEVERQCRAFAHAIAASPPDFASERALVADELERARQALGDMVVEIDALAHPTPFALARMLVQANITVTRVYADVIATDDEARDLFWLMTHHTGIEVWAMTKADMRLQARDRGDGVVAIGQRAAWFSGTSHFVNMVEGGGLWGFAGIREMARRLAWAATHEQDARDAIVRKGLGCASVI